MTKKERKELAKVKKRLQAEGVLPPNKPRLNRRKFAREVCEEWEEMEIGSITDITLILEILNMMTRSGKYGGITSEDIGILKLKKCVIEIKKEMQEQERSYYTYSEKLDVCRPIWKL
ncbi:hypothetical protein MKC66_12990 [[Clostridium] innocuum]|nr:hypothetical protein [[Clostridium] innocuum]